MLKKQVKDNKLTAEEILIRIEKSQKDYSNSTGMPALLYSNAKVRAFP